MQKTDNIAIIPQPQQIITSNGNFVFDKTVHIKTHYKFSSVVDYFIDFLQKSFDKTYPIYTKIHNIHGSKSKTLTGVGRT